MNGEMSLCTQVKMLEQKQVRISNAVLTSLRSVPTGEETQPHAGSSRKATVALRALRLPETEGGD